jgi:hypothetical protein
MVGLHFSVARSGAIFRGQFFGQRGSAAFASFIALCEIQASRIAV